MGRIKQHISSTLRVMTTKWMKISCCSTLKHITELLLDVQRSAKKRRRRQLVKVDFRAQRDVHCPHRFRPPPLPLDSIIHFHCNQLVPSHSPSVVCSCPFLLRWLLILHFWFRLTWKRRQWNRLWNIGPPNRISSETGPRTIESPAQDQKNVGKLEHIHPPTRTEMASWGHSFDDRRIDPALRCHFRCGGKRFNRFGPCGARFNFT